MTWWAVRFYCTSKGKVGAVNADSGWHTYMKDYTPPPPPPTPGGGLLALPTVLSSNAVLQRAPASAHVWGWAKPGETVTVNLNVGHSTLLNPTGAAVAAAAADSGSERGTAGSSQTAVAAADGSWSVWLPPQKASNGRTLTVSAPSGTMSGITLTNIAFGDNFVCGGQSNMAFAVTQAFNASAIIADASSGAYPDLRLFTVKNSGPMQPAIDVNVSTPYHGWAVTNGSTIDGPTFGWFSAVCYLYGRDLYVGLDRKVPIGLVASNVGGTSIRYWSSNPALEACEPPGGTSTGTAEPATVAAAAAAVPAGGSLWNGMIAPLLPYTMRGAIWYQGEANLPTPMAYACEQKAMISDWQKRFSTGPDGFHFTFVELAPGPGPQVAKQITYLTSYLRVSQHAALSMPNVSYATAVDLGDPFSPNGWWHPRPKQQVGARLQLVTLRDVYGMATTIASGPVLLKTEPHQASTSPTLKTASAGYRLSFGEAESNGLNLQPTPNCTYIAGWLNKSYENPPTDEKHCCDISPFEVLTVKGEWVRAKATLLDNAVTVATPQDDAVDAHGAAAPPIGVRYGWGDYPLCMLYNTEGLPASPFQQAGCTFDKRTKYTIYPMLYNVDMPQSASNSTPSGPALSSLGNFSSAAQCAEAASGAAGAALDLDSYTWFGLDFGHPQYAGMCYGRNDSVWSPANGCPNGDPGCGRHHVVAGQVCKL